MLAWQLSSVIMFLHGWMCLFLFGLSSFPSFPFLLFQFFVRFLFPSHPIHLAFFLPISCSSHPSSFTSSNLPPCPLHLPILPPLLLSFFPPVLFHPLFPPAVPCPPSFLAVPSAFSFFHPFRFLLPSFSLILYDFFVFSFLPSSLSLNHTKVYSFPLFLFIFFRVRFPFLSPPFSFSFSFSRYLFSYSGFILSCPLFSKLTPLFQFRTLLQPKHSSEDNEYFRILYTEGLSP